MRDIGKEHYLICDHNNDATDFIFWDGSIETRNSRTLVVFKIDKDTVKMLSNDTIVIGDTVKMLSDNTIVIGDSDRSFVLFVGKVKF